MIKRLLLVILCVYSNIAYAQIGGDNTYEFMNLSSSARIMSLGGVLLSSYDDDINLAQQLPSLNHRGMNDQLSINYSNYYGGVSFGSVLYGLSHHKFQNICLGLQYVNYGSFDATDEFGNSRGTFSAGEYAFQGSTAISVKPRLNIGAAFKAIYSNLETYNSFGVLGDFSATYSMKEGRLLSSILAKNMGYQIKTYDGLREPMPFELLIGVSNKLEHAPLRWSVTWSHLQRWNVIYENLVAEYDPITGETVSSGVSTRDKIFSHLQLGAELLFSENFNVRLGYNFKRRQELALDLYKHNVGFSWGFTMKVKKYHINYAKSKYHAVGAMHTFSIISNLKYFTK